MICVMFQECKSLYERNIGRYNLSRYIIMVIEGNNC